MDIQSKARVIFEAAEQLGWSNPAEIADFAKRLDQGLPAEDELSAVFHWLGQCRLVHKLDQFPYPPGVWEHYRVPDLLAVFEVGGKHHPVLIEVKTSVDPSLSWRPDYLSSLQRYASLLGLPLLVGWKHRTFWVLFEAKHFQQATTNLKMSFEDAMKQNLLGILAGDFSFCFRPGTGMHIRIRKLRETVDGFDGVIEDAYFSTADGRRHSGEGGVLQFFMCIDQEPSVIETESEVLQSFVIPTGQQAEFAHRALITLLGAFTQKQQPSWRQVLVQNHLPHLSGGPRRAARNALDAGFLQHVLKLRPQMTPEFLEEKAVPRWETVSGAFGHQAD
jgi:Holliday junction resolvase